MATSKSSVLNVGMKIHITGNAGAGKTTLARKIGCDLGVAVYSLDKIAWQPGWIKTPKETKLVQVQKLVSTNEWVIEGVSDAVRNEADIIIFLDVNRATSYWRCMKRNWKYLFSGRPSLPENCPEILIIPRLIKLIWRFKTHVRPKILADIAKRSEGSFVIENHDDLERLYRRLTEARLV